MTRRRDEVQAGVDSGVVVVVEGALDFELLLQITLKLFINVVHHRLIAKTKERSGFNEGKTHYSKLIFGRTCTKMLNPPPTLST